LINIYLICAHKMTNKLFQKMKDTLNFLGAIIVLIGVCILGVYHFAGINSNTLLAVAGLLMIVGFFTFLFMNKKIS